MTLIDGDRIITAQLYDDEHEEFTEKKMSIIEYVNAYTDEGVTKADVIEQTDVPDTNVGELINRQAAKSKAVYSPERHEKVVPVAELDWLPSVEPERKTGKWIRGEAYPHHIYCSECYKTFIPNDELRVWANGDIPREYCPNCGSKMEVDNE